MLVAGLLLPLPHAVVVLAHQVEEAVAQFLQRLEDVLLELLADLLAVALAFGHDPIEPGVALRVALQKRGLGEDAEHVAEGQAGLAAQSN